MRHGKKFNHLGRTAAHRKAMLANMGSSLIEHKRINTTVAKAKALKQFIEPLITKAKTENNQTTEKGTHNRRVVFSNLRSKEAVTELFSTVAEKVGDRPGGYTRMSFTTQVSLRRSQPEEVEEEAEALNKLKLQLQQPKLKLTILKNKKNVINYCILGKRISENLSFFYVFLS